MLEGRKTNTRRLGGLEKINEMPDLWRDPFFDEETGYWNFWQRYTGDVLSAKPRYQVGDLIYAREAWAQNDRGQILLKSEKDSLTKLLDLPDIPIKWKSPRFMFKKYARIWREIVGARPERLQEIPFRDIEAEGIWTYEDPWKGKGLSVGKCRMKFARLWDSTNPKHPWDRNEWVWRYEMKGVER